MSETIEVHLEPWVDAFALFHASLKIRPGGAKAVKVHPGELPCKALTQSILQVANEQRKQKLGIAWLDGSLGYTQNSKLCKKHDNPKVTVLGDGETQVLRQAQKCCAGWTIEIVHVSIGTKSIAVKWDLFLTPRSQPKKICGMSTTLPLFWHLSSSSKIDRIDASVKLIVALEQFQAQFTPESNDEEEDLEGEPVHPRMSLDAASAPDVSYSIRRLVRGLASPRDSSRLGFAVALTELLCRLDTISTSQVISLISEASQIQGSMKGQEERDMLFARLFGITSLIQSGILFRSTPLSTSSVPACTFQDFQNAMTMLMALPSQKSFLTEPSYWTFVLALRALDSSNVEWKEDAWTWSVQRVFSEDKSWSVEKVGVALVLQSLGVNKDWKLLLAPTFKHGDILSAQSLHNLAKTLMDIPIEVSDTGLAKSKGSGIWRPQLHWVWDIIFDIYFPSAGAPSCMLKPKVSFPEFFRVVVDDHLFAPSASDGRKLWGFEAFRLSVSRAPADDLPRLFTPNFMRSLMNHLSKPDRYLHKAAKLAASSLPPIIAANPSAGFPLVLRITEAGGRLDLTRTKMVDSMLAAMDLKGVGKYMCHLRAIACFPESSASAEDDVDPTPVRIWVADQLFALLRNGAIPKSDSLIMEVLDFFLLHGLFKMKDGNQSSKNIWVHFLPKPPFSNEMHKICRMRLLSSLAELTSQTTLITKGETKVSRSTGAASDGELWVSKVLRGIVALEKDAEHTVRFEEDDKMSPQGDASRNRTLEILGRLRNVSEDLKEAGEGAELLTVATLLFSYLEEGHDSYEDFQVCIANVTRLFPDRTQKSNSHKKKHNKENIDQEVTDPEVEPIDALVDTLIGYLEKSTAYLRVVANQVFARLSILVKESTVDLIVTQLERRDPRMEESDEENNSVPDDVLSENAGSGSGNSDSGVSEYDEDEEISDEDHELRKKVEDVLRNTANHAARDEPDDGPDSESSEDLMDDEQMMQLDGHLAEIFRSRAKGKGRGAEQREATHFKNRVLDFVDIFLRKQPTSRLVPRFILPLLQVIAGTSPDEKQLSDKALAILRSRIKRAKEVPINVHPSETRQIFQELHTMARRTHSADAREAISACSLYLTRIMLSDSVNDVKSVVVAYRATLADFSTRKSSPLQPAFFLDFVKRQPHAAWQMRDSFIQLAGEAVNGYRKSQTLQLLHPLLTQISLTLGDQSTINSFMRSFCQTVYTIIFDEFDDAESLSASQVKDLLKLCLLAIRQNKRFNDNANTLEEIWDVSRLTDLSAKMKRSRFKNSASLQDLCKQMHNLVNPNPVVPEGVSKSKTANPKKRKATGGMDDGDIKKARKVENVKRAEM